MPEELIWTRSLADWPRDEAMVRGANVPFRHLPCVHFEVLPPPSPSMLRQPRQAGMQMVYVFTSVHTVAYFPAFDVLKEKGVRVYAIGEATRAELAKHGVTAEDSAGINYAEDLAAYLAGHLAPAASSLVLPGPVQRAFPMEADLRSRGFQHVKNLDLYATRQGLAEVSQGGAVPVTGKAKSELLAHLEGVVCFASPSAVHGFCEGAEREGFGTRLRAVALGKTTARACEKYFPAWETANEPTLAALLAAGVKAYRHKGKA